MNLNDVIFIQCVLKWTQLLSIYLFIIILFIYALLFWCVGCYILWLNMAYLDDMDIINLIYLIFYY